MIVVFLEDSSLNVIISRSIHVVANGKALFFFVANILLYGASLVAQTLVRNLLHCRGPGFNLWVRKIPWRKEQLLTPVFLPGESHGQRSLMGYSPCGHKEPDKTEQLNTHILLYIFYCIIFIHLLMDTGCFYFLVIINNAKMNTVNILKMTNIFKLQFRPDTCQQQDC